MEGHPGAAVMSSGTSIPVSATKLQPLHLPGPHCRALVNQTSDRTHLLGPYGRTLGRTLWNTFYPSNNRREKLHPAPTRVFSAGDCLFRGAKGTGSPGWGPADKLTLSQVVCAPTRHPTTQLHAGRGGGAAEECKAGGQQGTPRRYLQGGGGMGGIGGGFATPATHWQPETAVLKPQKVQ